MENINTVVSIATVITVENSDYNPINSSDIVEPVILPITLYAFGNRTSPRPPRSSIDIAVEKDLVKPTQPPTGASTFADSFYSLSFFIFTLRISNDWVIC